MANLLFRTSTNPPLPIGITAKGEPLFNTEIDGNFRSLNDEKLEVSDAVSTNTANKVVRRDSSGNFSAGTITAALSGNATTATTLQTARTIGGVSFDGSANINLPGVNTTGNQNTTGSAATLTTARSINGTNFDGSADITTANWGTSRTLAFDGDLSGSSSVNGSANVTTTLTLGSTGVVAGTYGSTTQIPVLTIDSKGRVTEASTSSITVGDGTLSIATSGVGISGSGSFSANQGTNTTVTISSNATSANTVSTIVARDSSGNFSAGTITAVLSGNATTATTLQTARTINGVSFDGSANITITANTTNTLTRGNYLTGDNFNGSAATTWAVDATSDNTASKVVARDGNGDFAANVITVTDLNSTSDRNAKDNIQTIESAVDVVKQLRGTSFNWKNGGKKSYGVIAQEIEQVLPELVSHTDAGLAVSYTPLIAFLIEAIKQQDRRLDELESIINK